MESDTKKKKVISRRTFLKKAAGSAAAFSGIYILAPGKLTGGLYAAAKDDAATASGVKKGARVLGKRLFNHALLKKRFDAPVAVCRSEHSAEAAYNVLKLLKPALKSDRVLIKPNLACDISRLKNPLKEDLKNILRSLTTHPEFVEGIITYLKEEGIKTRNIVVAEGTGTPGDMPRYFDVHGYNALSEKMAFKLISLNEPEVYEVKIEDALRLKSVLVSAPLIDYLTEGVVINVPKLKMHNYAVCTLSMKNLMGTLYANKSRDAMHPELYAGYKKFSFKPVPRALYFDGLSKFSERLCDLCALAPDINVVDGVIAGEGDGLFCHVSQKPVPAHIALAGTNSINVDTVGAHFMGYSSGAPEVADLPELATLPWLEQAGKQKYGRTDAADVALLGATELPKYEKKFLYHRLAPVRSLSSQ